MNTSNLNPSDMAPDLLGLPVFERFVDSPNIEFVYWLFGEGKSTVAEDTAKEFNAAYKLLACFDPQP